MVPESLLNGQCSNAVIKERLFTVDDLILPQLAAEPTKRVRIALSQEERDRLHELILKSKLSNLTEAIVALLCTDAGFVNHLRVVPVVPQMQFGSNIVLSATLEGLIPQLQNWAVEDLIKLQLELPLIIEQKKEEVCDRRLEQAIIYLA